MNDSPFNKVLNEFLFLQADGVVTEAEGGIIRVFLTIQGKKVKSFAYKAERSQELSEFLKRAEFLSAAGSMHAKQVVPKPEGYTPIVLVVEDDPDQSKILEMMLKDLKYEVLLAGDGEEAMTVASDKTPDLIITDLMMPKMDGFEFVRKIKRNPAFQNIPVLVFTVINDPEKEFDLLNLGIDDYCQKTTQRNILMKRIENLVNRHIAMA